MTPPSEAWLLLGILAAVMLVVGGWGLLYQPSGQQSSLRGWTARRFVEHLEQHNEPYERNAVVGSVEVPFYLPDRDIAVVLTAPAFGEALDETPDSVHVELLAAERASSFLLQFDDIGDREKSVGGEVAAFQMLGIDPTTDMETIQEAFREEAKDKHPDRGGSAEAFQELTEARQAAMEYAERRD